jgi:hypothetical protein
MVDLLLEMQDRILQSSEKGQALTSEKIKLIRHHWAAWVAKLERLKRTTASVALRPPTLLQ